MEDTNAGKKIATMNVDQAKEWFIGNKGSEFIILDVRQPEEYRSGHLPGAVFIPLPDLINKVGELDHSKPIIAYCRSGNRSRAAAAFLLSYGFSKVYSMDGGITAWNGQVATGSYNEGLSMLEGRETAEELISLAMALEEGSRIFYVNVEELTLDTEAKNVLKTIAEAEEKHKTQILQAYKLITGENLTDDILNREPLRGIMEGGVRIDEVVSFLKGPDKTLLDILEVSMQLEINSLDLYIKILRNIEDAGAKKVFDILIEEEKNHLSKLGKLLGERAT
jgi:rhodanese-related sulfurtransferase/rubrerythrin